jgi:hypothetical protein
MNIGFEKLIFFKFFSKSFHIQTKAMTNARKVQSKPTVMAKTRTNKKLYHDRTWKGGCETINLTGKRKGLLCNCKFFQRKNGRKICSKHSNDFIDIDEGLSEAEQDDDIDDEDFDFIAEEDDGRKLINGRVYPKKVENRQRHKTRLVDIDERLLAASQNNNIDLENTPMRRVMRNAMNSRMRPRSIDFEEEQCPITRVRN